jgi:uncharacterized membrane protein
VPETDPASSILPIHIEETIQSIAGLNAEHHQRAVTRITSLLGRASFIGALTAFAVGWVSLNCLALALGYRAPDPPPLAWLAGASSLRAHEVSALAGKMEVLRQYRDLVTEAR